MALRAWYPLNGNVNNQGIGNFDLTQTTAPTWATGITCAQALNSGAYKWVASQTEKILNNTAFSYAAWIYVGDSDTRSMIFGNSNTGAGGDRWFSLFQYPTKNDFHASWIYNDSGSSIGPVITGALPTGKWTHIAAVYKVGSVKLYVNGVEKYSNSITYSISSFSKDYNVIYNNANHRLQDVRIYDHALSVKEVRELAKGLMVHIPFSGDGYQGIGTNIANGTSSTNSAWLAPKTINVGQYYSTLGINSNDYFGLKSGDTYTYRVKLTAPSTKGIKARVQYYTDSSTRTGPTSGITVAAGTTGYSYLTDTLTDAKRGYTQMQLLITNANTAVTSSDPVVVEEVKLERGSTATTWSPAKNSANYTPDYAIKDCSGYSRALAISATPPVIGNTGPRYGLSATFPSGSYITMDDPISPSAQEFTISVWINPSTVSGNQCIWNGRTSTSTAFSIFLIGSSIRVQDSGSKDVAVGLVANTWYHLVVTWKSGGNKVLYVNGVEKYSATAGTLNKSNTLASIGASSTGSAVTNNNYFSGMMSDYRIYATALSADDVVRLYNAPISISKEGEVFSSAFDETASKASFRNTGVVTSTEISECYGKFDSEVRFEPDGSAWMRVVHHADPGSNKFAQSDTFATQVYKNDKMFCHGKMFDYADRWELLLVQRTTSSAAVEKYRWVQNYNPNTATFANVSAANVAKNTSTEYSSHSSYGGIYHKGGESYYVANNSTNGNWYGALGCWTDFNTGIPGYAGKTINDGGYLDLYIRLDGGANWSWPTNTKAQVLKSDSSVVSAGFDETK